MSIAEKLTQIAENEQKVYEAGKQKEHSDFWDVFQNNGKTMSNYSYAFAYAQWNDENYNPKYKIKPSYSVDFMFYTSNITDTKIDIDVTNCTNMASVFRAAKKLKTIRKYIVKEATTYSYVFRDCDALENITFEGVIGNNIDFSYSPLLTVASMLNVFEQLNDIRGTGTTRTCTLGAENLAKLTDAEKAIATEKGWTLA